MDTRESLSVRGVPLEDWDVATRWGNAEGWNIGYRDPACFHATDPGGFFLGYHEGRPVSAVSLVNHSDSYAVWGNYLVHPDYRGLGFGRQTCRVARSHAGDRTIGCDAMPGMVDNYRKSGARPVHDTVLLAGPLGAGHGADPRVRPVEPRHLDAIAAYDSRSFPTNRRAFLASWLFAPGHVARLRFRDGAIVGYGVARPAPAGERVGPLVADTARDAEALFDTLVADVPAGRPVSVFAPEGQAATDAFFSARGLLEQMRVVRMYTGAIPAVDAETCFAIAGLELG